ncbi:hypothetical protein BJV77DRAFT_1071297 [Russula vinacea]|nr:hypothetical protein BJV77DRAFT_1071297 [Russula vinacea]
MHASNVAILLLAASATVPVLAVPLPNFNARSEDSGAALTNATSTILRNLCSATTPTSNLPLVIPGTILWPQSLTLAVLPPTGNTGPQLVK